MEEDRKECGGCGLLKGLAAFSKRHASKDGLASQCRSCRKAYSSKFREENIEIERERSRKASERFRRRDPEQVIRRRLKCRYGLSVEDYDSMLAEQEGKCRICGGDPSTHKSWGRNFFSVDHCHKTGKVRGIICQRCNLGLGAFKDDPQIMMKAISYIESFSGEL